jgi:hypothetical protein
MSEAPFDITITHDYERYADTVEGRELIRQTVEACEDMMSLNPTPKGMEKVAATLAVIVRMFLAETLAEEIFCRELLWKLKSKNNEAQEKKP